MINEVKNNKIIQQNQIAYIPHRVLRNPPKNIPTGKENTNIKYLEAILKDSISFFIKTSPIWAPRLLKFPVAIVLLWTLPLYFLKLLNWKVVITESKKFTILLEKEVEINPIPNRIISS